MTGTYKILIIDDEANLRRTLGLILQQTGYTVTCAGSGQEGQQCLQAETYDLIFLDLQMPDINGMALLPDIRRLYPDTPVLILTAHATLQSAMEAVRQGARDYLLKPITPQQILDRVRELIAEKTQPDRRREIVSQVQNLLSELHALDNGHIIGNNHNPYPQSEPARILRRGPFALDLHTHQVAVNGNALSLSPTAFEYLVTLLRHSPQPVSYETLVSESQGFEANRIEARDIVRWRIHELRKNIEPDPSNPQYIITERNIGYRLVT